MPANMEVADKPGEENNHQQQQQQPPEVAARYQNSYRLESSNPFKPELVERLVAEVMDESLEDFSYDSKRSAELCERAAREIRRRIRKHKFDRYKLVVLVSIIEKASQSLDCSMGFLWDHRKDSYAMYNHEGPSYYAYCCVLGVYYE